VLCLDRRTGTSLGFRPTIPPTDTPSGTNTSWASASLIAPTRSSGRVDGSSGAGTHAIIHTPTNVAAHPYMNVTNWWNLALLKSPYSIADPVIAERLKSTNCVGITTCYVSRLDTLCRLTRSTRLTVKTHKSTIKVSYLADASADQNLITLMNSCQHTHNRSYSPLE